MAGVDKALGVTIIVYAIFAGIWLVGYWMPDSDTLPAPPGDSATSTNNTAPIDPPNAPTSNTSQPIETTHVENDAVSIRPENDVGGWITYILFMVGAVFCPIGGIVVSVGIYVAKKLEKWRLLLALSVVQVLTALAWLAAAAFDILNTIDIFPMVLQIGGVGGGIILAGINSAFGFILFKENKTSPTKYTIFLDDLNDLDDDEDDELLSHVDGE